MSTPTVRVVQVITGLNVGGAEMMLWKLLAGMNGGRWDLHVVSLLGGGVMRERIEALGIPVTSLELSPGNFGPSAWLKLRSLGRELSPDVVQGWMYHGNLAASALAGGVSGSCRVFWNIRQTLPNMSQEKMLTRLVIRLGGCLAGKPEAVIYNAQVSLRQHQRYGYRAENAVHIGNGFDLEVFRPRAEAGERLRNKLGLAADTILVGQLGRWHPVKGFDIFLAAAAEVVAQRPDVHFVCAGQDVHAEQPDLRDSLARPGVKENVHFTGSIADSAEFLAGLDLLCSASRAEAFANVLGEAMACGVPCVVSDVGDSALIVGATGCVVPAADSAALARGILGYLDQPVAERQAKGVAARQWVGQNYGMAEVVGRYEGLYGGTL